MESLPYGLAAPLHIFPWWLAWIIRVLFMAIIGYLLIRYIAPYLRRAAKQPRPSATNKSPDIGASIDDLKTAILANLAYREGLFELSRVMKSYFEKTTGLPVEEMTAAEIQKNFSSSEPAKFFIAIERIACAKTSPDKKRFLDLCGHAHTAAAAKWKRAGR